MSLSDGTEARPPQQSAGSVAGRSQPTQSAGAEQPSDSTPLTNSSWDCTPSDASERLGPPSLGRALAEDWEQETTWRDNDSPSVRASWSELANTCTSEPARLAPVGRHTLHDYCDNVQRQAAQAAPSSSGTECYLAPHSLHSHSDNDNDIRHEAVLADCPGNVHTHYAAEQALAPCTMAKTMKATPPQLAQGAQCAAAVDVESMHAKPANSPMEWHLQRPAILYNRVPMRGEAESPVSPPAASAGWDEACAVSHTVGSVVDKCTALGAAGRPHTLRMTIRPVRHNNTGPYVPMLHASLQPYGVSEPSAVVAVVAPPPPPQSEARQRCSVDTVAPAAIGRRPSANLVAAEQHDEQQPPPPSGDKDDTIRDIEELRLVDQFATGPIVSVTSATPSELRSALNADRHWQTKHWRQQVHEDDERGGSGTVQQPQGADDVSACGTLPVAGSGSAETASERTLFEPGEQWQSAGCELGQANGASMSSASATGSAAATVRPSRPTMSSRTYTPSGERERPCPVAHHQCSTSTSAPMHHWPHWGAIHDGDTYYMWCELDPLLDTSDPDVHEAASTCASCRLDTTAHGDTTPHGSSP